MEIVRNVYRTYDEGEDPPETPVPDYIVRVTENRILLTDVNGAPIYDSSLERWAWSMLHIVG